MECWKKQKGDMIDPVLFRDEFLNSAKNLNFQLINLIFAAFVSIFTSFF